MAIPYQTKICHHQSAASAIVAFCVLDAIDGIAVVGVWRVTPDSDGDDCCYERAEISLRYDNPSNEDLWNKFLKHQLQEVVGTDIEVRFSRRSLAHRFS